MKKFIYASLACCCFLSGNVVFAQDASPKQDNVEVRYVDYNDLTDEQKALLKTDGIQAQSDKVYTLVYEKNSNTYKMLPKTGTEDNTIPALLAASVLLGTSYVLIKRNKKAKHLAVVLFISAGVLYSGHVYAQNVLSPTEFVVSQEVAPKQIKDYRYKGYFVSDKVTTEVTLTPVTETPKVDEQPKDETATVVETTQPQVVTTTKVTEVVTQPETTPVVSVEETTTTQAPVEETTTPVVAPKVDEEPVVEPSQPEVVVPVETTTVTTTATTTVPVVDEQPVVETTVPTPVETTTVTTRETTVVTTTAPKPKKVEKAPLRYYSQRDARWANQFYGSWNMDMTGCVPTTMAMAINSMNNTHLLPTDVANVLYNQGRFNTNYLGAGGDAVVAAAANYDLKTRVLRSAYEVKAELAKGNYVYAAVQGAPFTYSGSHAVLLSGNINGKTQVTDAYTRENNRSFDIESLWNSKSTDKDDNNQGSPFIVIYK